MARFYWARCIVCQKSPPVRHSTAHCSSPAWKRRCCTRLSAGRRRQSVDCARGAERECGSCRPLQRFSHDSRTAGWNQWSRQLSDLSFNATGSVLPATSTVVMLAADRSWAGVPRKTTSDLSALSLRPFCRNQRRTAECGRAVSEPVDVWRGVGAVHAHEDRAACHRRTGGMTRRTTRSARQQLTRRQ